MARRRDQLVGFGAALLMLALVTLIVATVIDAQQRGRHALERQKLEQVNQLAGSMDSRTQSAYAIFQSLLVFPPDLVIGSAKDQALLERFLTPTAKTGAMLVDSDGRVTSGTLLRDPSVIGKLLTRPGLAKVLRDGGSAFLPVAEGETTALPTLGIASAVSDPQGNVRGAMIFESEVSEDSDFNQEVKNLGGPGAGEFLFLDQLGAVVASSNPTLIGETIADKTVREGKLGLRREGGKVIAIADVPAAGWRAVFRQNSTEFEGGLTQRLQVAVLLIVVIGIVGGGLSVIALLARLRAARAEQRRMAEINEAREEFISIVSHELRTPVAGVLGFLQTTLDHWDALSDAERRDTIGRAAFNAQRLQALTRDVLDVSSAERGEIRYAFGPVDLREGLEAAVAATRESQPERTITVTAPDGRLWVRGDVDRLLQVVMNLLDNAVTSSPSGSPIEVVAEASSDDIEVSITDHGAGLAEGEVDTIFDKFVRGRASGIRGTGLGLYLCRQIVDAHDGRIWAEADARGGAKLRFTVPRAQETPDDAPPAAVSSTT